MVRGFVGALLLLPGCVIENNFLPPHWTDLFYQAPDDQVDILFVVDDSGSMTEEQQALSRGFGTFLAELEASETLYRIALVSTSQDSANLRRTEFIGDPAVLNPLTDTVSLFEERVLIGVDGSDHEKGLQAAADALEANPEFLRTGANLVVLFVTDEEDCSDDGRLDGHPAADCYTERQELTPVPDLVDRITRTKRAGEKVRLGGILGPLDGSCADAYPGTRYVRAIGQLGGPLARICDPDWSPALRELGAVATGMMDRFVLSYPADPETLRVFVDDAEVSMDPENGWTYDTVTQTLAFHGEAVPERNAEIRVEFEVASGG